MTLRGKKPQERNPRLKAMMFGPAGVGKTTSAIQMPKPYVIDTESGSSHYGDIIDGKGGSVFETNNIDEAITEVRALATEEHPYQSLIIDPFTPLYDVKLDEGEQAVGADFGRHYGYANKSCKRLFNLLAMLDMNVLVTCHAKNLYGDQMKILGMTFDGWKKLDYLFDLVFELQRRGTKRVAIVTKTRLPEFPDQSTFEWSYDALAEKYGAGRLEAEVKTIALASPEQVERFNGLYRQLSEQDVKRLKIDKVLASVDDVADLPADRIEKGTQLIESYLNTANAA